MSDKLEFSDQVVDDAEPEAVTKVTYKRRRRKRYSLFLKLYNFEIFENNYHE